MISEDTLTSLKSSIESTTNYRDVDLVRRDDWGAITFDSVKEHITYAINMTSSLTQMPLESLTDQAANDLQSHMPAVASLFARINDFGIEQGDASAMRNEIAIQVKDTVEQMHTTYSKWLPYLAYQRGDIARNICNRGASQWTRVVHTHVSCEITSGFGESSSSTEPADVSGVCAGYRRSENARCGSPCGYQEHIRKCFHWPCGRTI